MKILAGSTAEAPAASFGAGESGPENGGSKASDSLLEVAEGTENQEGGES